MDNGSLYNLEHEILPSQEDTINKFISDVMTTMQDQQETKNIDYLTGLPVRNVGQKTHCERYAKDKWMSNLSRYG